MKHTIGVDICDLRRVSKSIESSSTYLDYMFSPHEQLLAKQHVNLVNYYASLFAIKEATFKSLNIFWQDEMNWLDFNVHSTPCSHPVVSLSGKTKEIANDMGISSFSASNSQDGDFVIATVLCTIAL